MEKCDSNSNSLNSSTSKKLLKKKKKERLSKIQFEIPDDEKNQDFYKKYIEMLEKTIEELIQKNQEYEEKIKKLSDLENSYYELKIENLEYQKFKKLSSKFAKEQTNASNTILQTKNYVCPNSYCIANCVALAHLQKNYDKLLIDNSRLKQENLSYKYNI